MEVLRVFLGLILAIALGLYLNNAFWLAPSPAGEPMLYAHRGAHQPYERAGLTNDTCTAERMLPLRVHPRIHSACARRLMSSMMGVV